MKSKKVMRTKLLKLIIESYRDIWEESKIAFVLTVFPIVTSTVAIIISILK